MPNGYIKGVAAKANRLSQSKTMNCTILLLSFCISVTSVVGASGPEADFSIANEIPVLEAFFGTANLNLAQFTDPTLSNQEEDDDPVGPTPIIEDVPGAVSI